MRHLAAQPGRRAGQRRDRQRLPAAPRRPAQPAAARTPRTSGRVPSPFHYVGIVNEFPTAPKDSFFVANADYVAKTTGIDAVGAFLVDTGGTPPAAVADRCGSGLGTARHGHRHHPDPRPSRLQPDLGRPGRADPASSSPSPSCWPPEPAVSCSRLGLAERRRTFAIATVLGAQPATAARLRPHRGRCCWPPAALAGGALIGWALSRCWSRS